MSEEMKVVGRDAITLDAVDKQGEQRRVQLRATIIGPETARKHYEKQAQLTGIKKADQPLDDNPQSRAIEDQVENLINGRGVIRPPYNMRTLAGLREMSTELGQAIQAMVNNVVGFGWQLRERPMPEEIRTKFIKEIEKERFELEARLSAVHATMSLTEVRERAQYDKHATGQGFLELIENAKGELVGVSHLPGHSILQTKKQKKATPVEVPVVRPEQGFKIEKRKQFYRFRRYVQMRMKSAGKFGPVWFKEAGDPRHMDFLTGKYATPSKPVPPERRANSLICTANYNPISAYGVPLWIGNMFSILGSRASEEINYNTINSNAIPSMVVIVENGALTPASIARMREWTEQHIQNSANYSTFLILEGDTMEDGAPDTGNFRIKIEPLKRIQQQDELFQDYDANNKDKVRQAFRLPPIFVGRSEDYNRATADTSRDIADEQVFAPERHRLDWQINRHILMSWGAKFHTFRSNHPNITDDVELIRLMGITERSGAMTPRRADRIARDVFGGELGPMPKGIDPDTPYSLQFAQAQRGGGFGGGEAGEAGRSPENTEKFVKNLVALRKRIEEELEERALMGEDTEF